MSLRQYNLSVNISIVTPPPPIPSPTHAWHHDVIQLYTENKTKRVFSHKTNALRKSGFFLLSLCNHTPRVFAVLSPDPPQRQFSRELRTFWNLEIGSCRQRLRDNITGCSNMEFLFFILFFFKLESQRNVYIKNEANRLTGHCPKY